MRAKVVIIGSGPSGYTAAIYAARANLAPILFSGADAGGQLMTTTEVENFPGFPKGILGPALMEEMKAQAERFGTTIIPQTVSAIDFSSRPFRISVDAEVYEADAVIISTGAVARRLGIPSEKALYGKGVSACATCDGFFFKGKKVVVVGGGDAAMEEANFLTKFASSVTILHRSDTFRASKIMLERAQANPKITFQMNVEVAEVLGADVGHVTGVLLRNTVTSATEIFSCDGVFTAIGHDPSTNLFKGKVELDVKGYVITKPGTTETNVSGVFAAGDVADYRYRQAVTAAGTGCMAAIDVEKFLENIAHEKKN